ncbi:spore germination protein [Clostridium estertheticum]|uniref:spore germination protein n=1 Tax=Clostridium estertheticum TaxID=238834 RepID=UPI001C0D4972|nr:spore germination protein [Clostridium estertheticum]MBU3198490.1 spore germination protein [Clostridium estertheticum]WAG65166.1 spore germination protein [Clostridium estertheticum]
MFEYLHKKMRFYQLQYENNNAADTAEQSPCEYLSYNLKENLEVLKKTFGLSSDINYREFSFGQNLQIKAALIFLDGMTNKAEINDSIMKPFMYDSRLTNLEDKLDFDNLNAIKTSMLSSSSVEQVSLINAIVEGCLSGDTILLIDKSKDALVINTRDWDKRAIAEPKTESSVRGPREGFTESIHINKALLRRKIKNQNFTLEEMKIGKQTKTSVCIVYINGIVNPKLVSEIKLRLNRINTDAILESGYIEQFIEDAPYSIFTTVGNSEKPDKVAAKLLEGRAAIIVDGTPFVLTVPLLFIESFQSSEDYYSRPYFSSFVRIIRFAAYGISLLAPAVYVALSTFNHELIPMVLLFSMSAAHEGVPFPAVFEAIIMIGIFEILREAGVRLPRNEGQAISIVGALVIGQAAVSAGLIGAPMVIVVSLTAVSSFVVTPHLDSSVILRSLFLIMAGIFGAFGILVALLGLLIHLCSLKSFGTPYLSPLAPMSISGLKDAFFRFPLWAMNIRPKLLGWNNSKRQATGLKPLPTSEKKIKT